MVLYGPETNRSQLTESIWSEDSPQPVFILPVGEHDHPEGDQCTSYFEGQPRPDVDA